MEREIMREGRTGKTEEAGKEWGLAPTDFSLRAKPHPRSMLWAWLMSTRHSSVLCFTLHSLGKTSRFLQRFRNQGQGFICFQPMFPYLVQRSSNMFTQRWLICVFCFLFLWHVITIEIITAVKCYWTYIVIFKLCNVSSLNIPQETYLVSGESCAFSVVHWMVTSW